MRKLTKLSALLLVALMGLSACGKSDKTTTTNTVDSKTSEKMKGDVLLAEQKKGALVIDVRKTEQYAEGHIKDAKNIPLATIADEIAKVEPNKDKKIILYCNSGNQSGQAQKKLQELGYKDVHNADGVKDYKYELVK